MRINHVSKSKRNSAATLLLSTGLVITLFAGVTTSAQAQSGVAQRQAETGITTFYYSHKSNAVGKMNVEKNAANILACIMTTRVGSGPLMSATV